LKVREGKKIRGGNRSEEEGEGHWKSAARETRIHLLRKVSAAKGGKGNGRLGMEKRRKPNQTAIAMGKREKSTSTQQHRTERKNVNGKQ